MYFRSRYQAVDFPEKYNDLEAQINNTAVAATNRRTGNLFPVGPTTTDDDVSPSPTVDNVWTHMRILVMNQFVTIEIDGVVITQHPIVDPLYHHKGTICLQGEGLAEGFDRIEFPNIFIRELPVSGCDGWDQGSSSVDPVLPLGSSPSHEILKSIQSPTVAHYHFDDSFRNGSQDLYHFRAYGNTSLASDNMGWMASPLPGSQAIKFTGRDDFIVAVFHDDDIQPDPGQSLTIEALLYVDHAKEHNDDRVTFLSFGGLRLDENKYTNDPEMTFNHSALDPESTFGAFWSEDQWFHLKIVYEEGGESSMMRVYLNENLVAEEPASLNATSISHWDLTIGNFEGYVDEVRITKSAVDGGDSAPIELGTWRTRCFPAADLADACKEATHWGDDAEFDGDGFNTLAEYFLGLNPLVPDGLASLDASSFEGPVVIDFMRADHTMGVDWDILSSSDLTMWLPQTDSTTTTMTDGLLYDHLQVDLPGDFSADVRAFFSLGVSPAAQ